MKNPSLEGSTPTYPRQSRSNHRHIQHEYGFCHCTTYQQQVLPPHTRYYQSRRVYDCFVIALASKLDRGLVQQISVVAEFSYRYN